MPRKTNEIEPSKNPSLLKPRQEVFSTLLKRIEIGQVLLEKAIRSDADINAAYKEKDKWHEFNLEYFIPKTPLIRSSQEHDKMLLLNWDILGQR
jgi:hypothetical protein